MIRAQRGNGYQWAATIGIAVGGGLLAAGVITYFIVRRPAASVAVTPTANGFALGGTW